MFQGQEFEVTSVFNTHHVAYEKTPLTLESQHISLELTLLFVNN